MNGPEDRSAGIPAAVDALAAFARGLYHLTPAELAAAVAEVAYQLAAEAQRDGFDPLEHVLARDSLAGALAAMGYGPEARAILARPMPKDPAPLRVVSAVAEAPRVIAEKGDDVLANGEGGQVRGRVAFRSGDAVFIREFGSNSLLPIRSEAVVRNFTRQPEAPSSDTGRQ